MKPCSDVRQPWIPSHPSHPWLWDLLLFTVLSQVSALTCQQATDTCTWRSPGSERALSKHETRNSRIPSPQ